MLLVCAIVHGAVYVQILINNNNQEYTSHPHNGSRKFLIKWYKSPAHSHSIRLWSTNVQLNIRINLTRPHQFKGNFSDLLLETYRTKFQNELVSEFYWNFPQRVPYVQVTISCKGYANLTHKFHRYKLETITRRQITDMWNFVSKKTSCGNIWDEQRKK